MGPDSRRASVPPGWTRTKLGDVASVRSSNVDKKKRPSEISVRLCNYMDVYSNDIVHDQLNFMVASATKTEIGRFGLVDGDVVITKDSETPDDIAVPAVVRGPLSAPLVCGYHLAILRASHERVSGEFLAFALRSSEVNAPFRKAANGSTRYGLSIDAIERAPLTLPPPSEQRRIAEILDTLDEAIRKTEQVIAKLQQMKRGLLHDLLTRGIDEHGELRDPERHPEQFKDSPLGLIPRGSEVVVTGSVATSIVPGRDKPVLDGGAYPWITVTDLNDDGVARSRLGLSLSLQSIRASGARIMPAGAVLMSCVGEFGIASVVQASVVANQQLHGFVPRDEVRADWLMFCVREQGHLIDRMATQTTIKYLNKAGCESIQIPLPPRAEQDSVVVRVRAFEAKLLSEQTAAAKLRTLKHGLMDDLLTGRVRVAVPEEATR